MTRKAPLLWSVPVAVHEVPESGRRIDLVADGNMRDQLAKVLGLRSLPRLEASFDVTRHGSEGLRVAGRVSATVGQTCVVTLEPIDNEVAETIDLVFVPQTGLAIEEGGGSRAVGDLPEPLNGGAVDLGAIATEFLTLGIDPYPRKSGVAFESQAAEDELNRPFAALAALKKGRQES
jgi:uncharacterized metal-binding protein YceD (DUF177 family)